MLMMLSIHVHVDPKLFLFIKTHCYPHGTVETPTIIAN